MIDITKAKERNRWLHRNGQRLLDIIDLEPKLATFGDVQSIGSFSYNLMQVADIDFKIYSSVLDQAAILALAHQMSERPDVIGVRHLDFTKQPNSKINGIYLSIFPYFEGELWKLDLLFLPLDSKPVQEDPLIAQLKTLTPQQRDIILLLKAQLLDAGLYSNPTVFHTPSVIHGADLYRAVLNGAKTMDDAIRYKKEMTI